MKQKIVLQKDIHFEYDREPLHPVFESCLDGVTSLKKMEENLFTKLRALDDMFPFCEDFEFIKQIKYNDDKTSYSSWYELIGTVELQTGVRVDNWETKDLPTQKIEDMTIKEIQVCIESMKSWVDNGNTFLGKELEAKMKSDMNKKIQYFEYTYFMMLTDREKAEILQEKEIALFDWQK